MGCVQARYAAALLETAQSDKQADETGDVLDAYAAAINSSAELRSFLASPMVPAAAKKTALARMMRPVPETVAHFLALLVDKRRIDALAQISEEYQKKKAALRGIPVVAVTAAAPLAAAEVKNLRAWLCTRYGVKDVRLVLRIQPDLIGGVRVQVGDTLVDGSLRGRLDGLGRAIREAR